MVMMVLMMMQILQNTHYVKGCLDFQIFMLLIGCLFQHCLCCDFFDNGPDKDLFDGWRKYFYNATDKDFYDGAGAA